MKTINFKSSGFVYGILWDNSEGAYPARELTANNKRELLKKANEGLNGSLDSGMGFQGLKGALLDITKITTIQLKSKTYKNKQSEIAFIGNLTEKEKDFLYELWVNKY